MTFDQICSRLKQLYAPDRLNGREDPGHYKHQPAVIARAWQILVEHGRAGVVLADEVGLGKTYEALATLYFYLLDRLSQSGADGFRVFIVLPPRLVTKWTDELERFAEQLGRLEASASGRERDAHAAIVRAMTSPAELRTDGADLLAGDQPLRLTPAGIFLVRQTALSDLLGIRENERVAPKVRRKFGDLRWDVVIADEAHAFARGDDGQGNQRSRAMRALAERVREVGTKLILCTATPFQLDTSELVSLLGLLESRPKVLDGVRQAIETYNALIVSLRTALEKSHDRPTELMAALDEARADLEARLRQYLLRSQRPEKESQGARQYQTWAIEPGEYFPWSYWQVRDWARALARSGVERVRTFLPATLQITMSSYQALAEHLGKPEARHFQVAGEPARIRARLVESLRVPAGPHPKFDRLAHFMRERILSAAQSFNGDPDSLAEHKCVIFVNHLATIEGLVQSGAEHARLTDQLESVIRARTDAELREHGLEPEEFRASLQEVAERATEAIRAEYPFHSPDAVIPIWETPYESQFTNDYHHMRRIEWGVAEDRSGVRATGNEKSVGEMFDQNLCGKVTETLAEYQLARAAVLAYGGGQPWLQHLEIEVAALLEGRVNKELKRIHRLYYGHDLRPDQPPEWLRLRLSRLAFSFTPRQAIEKLTGGVEFATRQQVIDAFNNDLFPLTLVCSSVAEEGIDLQRRCNTVIHYDLEWNPAKVEQREGRVDRLGRRSTSPVQITTAKLEGAYDERILARCENRKIWMELYLCKTWQDEGKQAERDGLDAAGQAYPKHEALHWVRQYRLNLVPAPIA